MLLLKRDSKQDWGSEQSTTDTADWQLMNG